MHRIIVAILSGMDALLAALIGLVAALAPLTVVFAVAFGTNADWASLWSTSVGLWQLANLVPQTMTLTPADVATLGLPDEASTFVFSLAPLAVAAFVVSFAWRSGIRSVRSGAGMIGWVAGGVMTAVVAAIAASTSEGGIMSAPLWQAVLLPSALYFCAAAAGGVWTAWEEGDDGLIDRLHIAVDRLPSGWGGVISASLRGVAVALIGLVGAAALLLAIAIAAGMGEMIALFERARVDLLGAVVVGVAHLAYLPTAIGWALSWIAGPGFSVGEGTAVSPAGTELGVLPGIPLFGLIPEQSSPWLLVLALIPVGVGFAAGIIARAALRSESGGGDDGPEPVWPRAATALAIATLAAGAAAVIAAVSSGSVAPGRLAFVGPEPGPLAFAVGVEVAVGAVIALVGPTRDRSASAPDVDLTAASVD